MSTRSPGLQVDRPGLPLVVVGAAGFECLGSLLDALEFALGRGGPHPVCLEHRRVKTGGRESTVLAVLGLRVTATESESTQ
jgi:hypothetical protein